MLSTIKETANLANYLHFIRHPKFASKIIVSQPHFNSSLGKFIAFKTIIVEKIIRSNFYLNLKDLLIGDHHYS